MRETDTIHWVGPLPRKKKNKKDNAEKGLYTAGEEFLQIASKIFRSGHTNSQARVNFMRV